jgi:uncharacterized caspase-like protein
MSALSATLATSAFPQPGAGRVALIIGNANYPDARTPPSIAVRDARALAEEFRRFDFDVDLKEDVGKNEMRRAIDAFVTKIKPGTAAIFYFGGFGLQTARQTYLIPLDARIWNEADVRRDGISLDAVLGDMRNKGAMPSIVMIDAARRNPFERRFRTAPAGPCPAGWSATRPAPTASWSES